MLDHRYSKRHRTIWKVYKNNGEEQVVLIGYLMDISSGGARFFLDDLKNFDVKSNSLCKMLIRIGAVDAKSINVQMSWYKEWQKPELTYEIGVKFIPADEEEEKYIETMLKEFEKLESYNTEINIELSEIEKDLSEGKEQEF